MTGPRLLIETQGPWRGPGAGRFLADAAELARLNQAPQVVLLADGVTSAIGPAAGVAELLRLGVEVLAEDEALRRRSLLPADLMAGVGICDIKEVARMVLEPDLRIVWH